MKKYLYYEIGSDSIYRALYVIITVISDLYFVVSIVEATNQLIWLLLLFPCIYMFAIIYITIFRWAKQINAILQRKKPPMYYNEIKKFLLWDLGEEVSWSVMTYVNLCTTFVVLWAFAETTDTPLIILAFGFPLLYFLFIPLGLIFWIAKFTTNIFIGGNYHE